MLTMDDIKYIKRMYNVEGCSIREIIRRTGYHYETVRKYLDMEDFNKAPKAPKEISSMLDPLKPTIDSWLENDLHVPRKQRHTAQRIYDRLIAEYPNEMDVKLRTVQYYVSKKKKQLMSQRSKAYLPLLHPPGEARLVHHSHLIVFGRESWRLKHSLMKGNAN